MKTIAVVCGALAVLGLVSGGCGSSDPIAGTGGVGTGGAASGGAASGGAASGGRASSGGAIGTGGTGTGGALGGFGGMAGGDTGGAGTGGAATGGAAARPECDEIPSLEQGTPGSFTVGVAGFEECDLIPDVHTCEGAPFRSGTSPEIAWTDGPDGTVTYAVVFKDLSILETTDPDDYFNYGHGYHWAVWDIPLTETSLDANLGVGHEVPGIPDARQWASYSYSYFGPCPNYNPAAPTDLTDTYSFVVYALPATRPGLIPPAVTTPDYSPVRALDDYFKTIAIAAVEYRGISDAHSTEFPGTLGETLPPCSAGALPADCIALP